MRATIRIAVKTWFGATGSENSYYVEICGWSHSRRVIERDGLISFQVTVHKEDRRCFTCKERVRYIQEVLAYQNVQCFWTREPDDGSLYVTVGPPPPGASAEIYLSSTLLLPMVCSRPEPRKQENKKITSRNRRHIVH